MKSAIYSGIFQLYDTYRLFWEVKVSRTPQYQKLYLSESEARY